MSKKLLDVRGLACPEPVMAFHSAIKEKDVDCVEITLDKGAPENNVPRAAAGSGWILDAMAEQDGAIVMTFSKKTP